MRRFSPGLSSSITYISSRVVSSDANATHFPSGENLALSRRERSLLIDRAEPRRPPVISKGRYGHISMIYRQATSPQEPRSADLLIEELLHFRSRSHLLYEALKVRRRHSMRNKRSAGHRATRKRSRHQSVPIQIRCSYYGRDLMIQISPERILGSVTCTTTR